MGFTPWGTYLACEENFNGYFRKTGAQTALERRYGITAAGAGYLWHTTDKRFRADEEPNEPNRFGWVVEFDPFNPHSTPVKRTALGRLKHEGAWVQEARDGRVVVYMGDDEQFEYIYRYVSNLPWREARRSGINPLDDGILYVAKFNDDGSGEWLPLTPDNPALAGWSLNDILINTRGAADPAGATKMDRPEWIDTFPDRSRRSRRSRTTPRAAPATARCVDAAEPAHAEHVRPHHQLVLRRRLHRADVRLGHLRARRRPREYRRTARHRRRQVRFAGWHLRRAERPALDPDRRVGQHDQQRAPTPASATTRCSAPTR